MDQYETADEQLAQQAADMQARMVGGQTMRVMLIPAEDPAIVRARDGVAEATLGSRAMRLDLFANAGRHSFNTNTLIYRD